GLGRDEAADAVVERSRDDAALTQLDRAGIDHRDVPDSHERARLVAVLRADVDVQVLELGCTLAVLFLEQMDRLSAYHSGHLAFARGDDDALRDQHERVPPSDLAEFQVAVVVDVGDVQSDLVDVSDDGNRRAVGRATDTRKRRADEVTPDLSRERAA